MLDRRMDRQTEGQWIRQMTGWENGRMYRQISKQHQIIWSYAIYQHNVTRTAHNNSRLCQWSLQKTTAIIWKFMQQSSNTDLWPGCTHRWACTQLAPPRSRSHLPHCTPPATRPSQLKVQKQSVFYNFIRVWELELSQEAMFHLSP